MSQAVARRRNESLLLFGLSKAAGKLANSAARERLKPGSSTRVVYSIDAAIGRAQFHVDIDGKIVVGTDEPKRLSADKNRLIGFLLERLGPEAAAAAMRYAEKSIEETGEPPTVDPSQMKVVAAWCSRLTVDAETDKKGSIIFDGAVEFER